MDSSSKFSPVVLFSLFLILLISTDAVQSLCFFDHIFNFGDSMADAGNGCLMAGGGCLVHPYGETYFHKPNGRWSDGRLIVDFIAEAYGLPHPPPSMAGNTPEYFQHGANFAVAAAQALNYSTYKEVTGRTKPRLFLPGFPYPIQIHPSFLSTSTIDSSFSFFFSAFFI